MLPLLLVFLPVLSISMKYDNPSHQRDYLMRFGYLAPPDPITGSLVSMEDFEKSIEEFQLMVGLPQTGTIDNATIEMMGMPRCGVSDKLGTNRFTRRKKRYNLEGSRWYKNSLTYHITDYTRRLPREDVTSNLRMAFKIWSDHANLTVTESSAPLTADILISFSNGSHGDSFPFDGRGGVLAHAFFPARGGDMHFDDTENWILGYSSVPGVDFLFAAVHEFGHTLGLGHSDVRSSIMAPLYRGHVADLQLNYDDIRAVQALYGMKYPVADDHAAGADALPAADMEGDELCRDATIDGITTTHDGSTYIYKGVHYWKLETAGRLYLTAGYPQPILGDWGGMRGNIDSVYTTHEGDTYFFKGDKYWQFINRVQVIGSQNISERFPGLPGDIDAIFIWTGNGKTYVIKGEDYYGIEEDGGRVLRGYPKDITIWGGLPYGRINAAFNFENHQTYFFSGKNYYRYNDRRFRVDDGFPLPTASRWFGCVANLISKEGLYNRQWLEVEGKEVFTQTYPPDVTDKSLSYSSSHNMSSRSPRRLPLAACFMTVYILLVTA